MTPYQRKMLVWLKEHTGTGVLTSRGASTLIAGGEIAPCKAITWLHLVGMGMVSIEGNRIRLTSKGNAEAQS